MGLLTRGGLLVAMITAAAVSLAGCGSSSSAASGPTGSSSGPATPSSVALPSQVPLTSQPPLPTVTGGRVLSPDQLTAALLPAEALPAGFSQDDDAGTPPAGQHSEAPSQVGTSTPPVCGQLLDPVAGLVPGVAAQSERSFTGPDAFTSVTQDAATYPTGGAVATLGEVRSAAAQCATFSGTDADGVKGDYTLGAPPGVSGAGDASIALRLVGRSEGVQAVFDVVVAVAGTVVVQVIASGLTPLDPGALTSAIGTAVDRLRAAQN